MPEKKLVDHWQWDPVEGYYVAEPTYPRAENAPPGYYELGWTPYRKTRLKEIKLKEDKFIDFKDGPLAQVLAEVDKFWRSSHKYEHMGVAHKRSILLHGPPGTGKSMIMLAMIRHVIGLEGIAIKMNDPDDFHEQMQTARLVEKNRHVVVVCEDLDSLIRQEDEVMGEILDGTGTLGQNILYISTTNYLEKIPERFRDRPSRIDTLIEVPAPSYEQRVAYIHELLGEHYEDLYLELAAQDFTMAEVKEGVTAVYVYERSMEETIARLKGGSGIKKAGKRKDRILKDRFVNGYNVQGNDTVAMAVNVKDPKNARTFAGGPDKAPDAFQAAIDWAAVQAQIAAAATS